MTDQRDNLRIKMVALLYGELPESEAEEIRRAVDADPVLAAEFSQWQSVTRTISENTEDFDPAPRVRESVLTAAREAIARGQVSPQTSDEKPSSWLSFIERLGAAPAFAGFGLVVLAAGLLYTVTQEYSDEGIARFTDDLQMEAPRVEKGKLPPLDKQRVAENEKEQPEAKGKPGGEIGLKTLFQDSPDDLSAKISDAFAGAGSGDLLIGQGVGSGGPGHGGGGVVSGGGGMKNASGQATKMKAPKRKEKAGKRLKGKRRKSKAARSSNRRRPPEMPELMQEDEAAPDVEPESNDSVLNALPKPPEKTSAIARPAQVDVAEEAGGSARKTADGHPAPVAAPTAESAAPPAMGRPDSESAASDGKIAGKPAFNGQVSARGSGRGVGSLSTRGGARRGVPQARPRLNIRVSELKVGAGCEAGPARVWIDSLEKRSRRCMRANTVVGVVNLAWEILPTGQMSVLSAETVTPDLAPFAGCIRRMLLRQRVTGARKESCSVSMRIETLAP